MARFYFEDAPIETMPLVAPQSTQAFAPAPVIDEKKLKKPVQTVQKAIQKGANPVEAANAAFQLNPGIDAVTLKGLIDYGSSFAKQAQTIGGDFRKPEPTPIKKANFFDSPVVKDFREGFFADVGTQDPRLIGDPAKTSLPFVVGSYLGTTPEGQADDLIKGVVKGVKNAPKLVEQAAEVIGDSVSTAKKYVAEQIAKREAARLPETPGLIQRVKGFYDLIKRKMAESNAPIEDTLRAAQKESKFSLLPKDDISQQIDRSLRGPTLAGQFVRDNGLEQVIKEAEDLDELDQYLIARQAKTVEARGFKTGRDAAKDAQLLEAFGPKYEPYAKQVTEYSRKALDYMVESGLISADLAKRLKEIYPDYAPLGRIFSELEDIGQTNPRGVASLSTQSVVQRLAGSEREIESPIVSLLSKTNDMFLQGEKNKAARLLADYKNLPGNPFQIVPLRLAENVLARIRLFGDVKILKPLQDKAQKMMQTRGKWLRQLQSDINKLEKEGLAKSLRSKTPDKPALQSGFKLKTTPEQVVFGEREMADVVVGGKLSEKKVVGDVFARLRKVGDNSVKSFVEALISEPNLDVAAIKKMVETRSGKLTPLLDDIQKLRSEFETLRDTRLEMLDEARLLKDAETRGKATFSVIKGGIREIYETTPEIAAAAKSLNVQQLSVLERIFALPVRLAKLGITGINLPFVAKNIVVDQLFTAITSRNSLKTSVANPVVFLRALMAAVKHDDLYQEMVRAGAGGTSFDIARDQVPVTVKSIRAGRNTASKILYTVTHPGELLTTVENIFARSEEFTRLTQFEGTKQAGLQKGLSKEDAIIEAAIAARENSANFMRRGEWGNVLNATFLYLNAGIQGSRAFIRAFERNPVGTSGKIATVLFFPTAVATAWNLSDPTRKAAYEDIPEYEKEGNIIFIPPNPTKDEKGRWNAFKVPMPPGVGALASVVRRGLEHANGLDQVRFSEVAHSLFRSVSPVDIDKGSILSTFTPQALKPTLEAATNQNFFTGYPQVSQGLEKLSPELQVKPGTSGTARKIAGPLNVSPIKVEEFIKGTFGGVGSQALNASDQVLAGLDIIPKDQVGGQNIIEAVLARFNKARGGELEQKSYDSVKQILTKQADERFRLKQEAEILYTELKELPKDQANAKASEIKRSNPLLYDRLKDTVEEAKLGLTYDDRLVKQLGVENGERAKFIWGTLQGMGSNEEKNAYVSDLRKKKVISDTVFKQLKQLKNEQR